MKTQSTLGENLYRYISNKKHVSKIHKKNLKLNKKKINQFDKYAKYLKR
jgi:Fe-S cluster biosynthesis and repair protein YggX